LDEYSFRVSCLFCDLQIAPRNFSNEDFHALTFDDFSNNTEKVCTDA